MKSVLCCFAFMLLLPVSVQAETFKPYAGSGLRGLSIGSVENWDSLAAEGLREANVYAGARVFKYFGGEIGAARTFGSERELWSSGTMVRTYDVTLDAMGYVPLDSDGRVELIGAAGFAYRQMKGRTETALSPSGQDAMDTLGLRFGGGAQYNLSDELNLRGMARYSAADTVTASSDVSYTVALSYMF